MTTLTDSTYDLCGSQYKSKVDRITFATPFEQNSTYCMRSWNKPFQSPKWPSDGTNSYEKRAPNNIDLNATLTHTRPCYEAKDWSGMKTVVGQCPKSEKYGPPKKEKLTSSRIHNKSKFKCPCKNSEKYNTSPFCSPDNHVVDTWSSAGRIQNNPECFKMFGEEYKTIDIIIIALLFVFFVLICVYGYMVFTDDKSGSTASANSATAR